MLHGDTGLVALVWLVPVLYPFSFQALFSSARLAQEHVAGMPLVALTLMWAFAGPFVAVFALNQMGADRFERASTRLLVFGALIAAISPALFVLVSRVGLGLSLWYGAVALGSLVALFRWPTTVALDRTPSVRPPAVGPGSHGVCAGAHRQSGIRFRQSLGVHRDAETSCVSGISSPPLRGCSWWRSPFKS